MRSFAVVRGSSSVLSAAGALALALLLGACQAPVSRDEISAANYVEAHPDADQSVGPYQALGENAATSPATVSAESAKGIELLDAATEFSTVPLEARPEPRLIRRLDHPPVNGSSLVLGFPLRLVGQPQIFGGVITRVSDQKNESLGRLKLTDLPPVHVKPRLAGNAQDGYVLALMGRADKCAPGDDSQVVITFPVVGVDTERNLALVDLGPMAGKLNLIRMSDPDGAYTKLKTRSSRTLAFDFTEPTLVFDIETTMIPLAADLEDPAAPETHFTVRWYLRQETGFDSSFEPRSPVKGVGYFTTRRGQETRISRFASSDQPVKYYLKNVPREFRDSFAAALDEWNEKLEPVLGRNLLSYEFLAPDDERAKLLVTGDVRYNVIEWDLVNKAPYGGLGPSVAHQHTGQIFGAWVLVQGPEIMSIYRKWFAANQEADHLIEIGRPEDADKLLVRVKRELNARIDAAERARFSLDLGNDLPFRIPAQMPSLEDPLMQRVDFDSVPAGYTFDTYMDGYFRELVAHEVGHNLGLRHNFRGNLGSTEQPELGKVSRSIMEYLNKSFRYLNRISEYDVMAIAFGYTGKAPAHADWFCTDQDAIGAENPKNSAECSKDDAGADPFGYFEERLAKSIDYLIARGRASAPVWEVDDMTKELTAAVSGIVSYASSAQTSARSWTNFFSKPGRPAQPALVAQYVLERLRAGICDPSFQQVLASKESAAAREKTRSNIEALRAKTIELAKPYGIFTPDDLACPALP